jgi:hypothetical protein
MPKAIRAASNVVVLSAQLYRELVISALMLVPWRRKAAPAS